MSKMWKKEEHAIVLKPHEKRLPLQWMHKWHHVSRCVHCHVNIIKNGYSKNQWDEFVHNNE
jgi:hypothetical protein